MPYEEEGDEFMDLDREEFVPVVHARNERQAEMYRQLLEDHDIESMIGYDEVEAREDAEGVVDEKGHGLPVLVPETLLDEASEVIADREDLDEFEPSDDVDEDIEDDEFELDPESNAVLEEADDDLYIEEEDDEYEEDLDDEDEY